MIKKITLTVLSLIITYSLLEATNHKPTPKFDIIYDTTDSTILVSDGTFQLISKSKVREIFTTERLQEIKLFVENNRHETEEIILDISQYTMVRIPSKQSIESPNFNRFFTLFEE